MNLIAKIFKSKEMEPRVLYNIEDNNGLIFNDNYIPSEIFTKIFCFVDHKSLLKCQLVCKNWQILIQDCVWHKKATIELGHWIPIDKSIPWKQYYLICDKKPFYRNLVKNHSGAMRFQHWEIIHNGGDQWKVENPPVGVPPLPEDPVFEGKNVCFVTSYGECSKEQIIDLADEGFTHYLLDNVQPIIKISEWYSCRWDCAAVFQNSIDLIGDINDSKKTKAKEVNVFEQAQKLEEEKSNDSEKDTNFDQSQKIEEEKGNDNSNSEEKEEEDNINEDDEDEWTDVDDDDEEEEEEDYDYYSDQSNEEYEYYFNRERNDSKYNILKTEGINDRLVDDRQNKWFQFTKEIKDYGKGLRKIRYFHGGRDRQFWAGHYGCKMAGACVILEWPKENPKLEES